MESARFKAIAKKRKPRLLKKHYRERLNFVTAHQDLTLNDLKRFIWLDETKIKRFSSDDKLWAWKGERRRDLVDRGVMSAVKFEDSSITI